MISSKGNFTRILWKGQDMKPCNEVITETISLAETMLILSDKGDSVREDDGCGILYGVIRDTAYKIKKMAETERQNHIKNNTWR